MMDDQSSCELFQLVQVLTPRMGEGLCSKKEFSVNN